MATRKPNELRIYHPPFHAGQTAIWKEMDAHMKRHKNFGCFYLCAHRGWFKSTFAIERAYEYLQAQMPVGWYASTFGTINNVLNDMFSTSLGGKENLYRYYNKEEHILSLPGHGPVHFYSLVNASHAAGPTFPCTIIDESGDIPDDVVESVVLPIVEKGRRSFDRGELLAIGTPNRSGNPRNWFWEKLMGASGPEGNHWEKSWVVPVEGEVNPMGGLDYKASPYVNPLYDWEWAQQAYEMAKNKVSWRVEYLCEFLSQSGMQFSQIDNGCCLPYEERPDGNSVAYWKPGFDPKTHSGSYQIGVDIGIRHNRTSIGVLDLNSQEMVYWKWFLPGDWGPFYRAVMETMDMFPGLCVIDATGNDSVPETFANLGYYVEGAKFTGANKAPLLDNLSFLLERGQVRLFCHPQILLELSRMKREARPSGVFKIEGDGAPDDIPMSLSLMVKGVPVRSLAQGDRIPNISSISFRSAFGSPANVGGYLSEEQAIHRRSHLTLTDPNNFQPLRFQDY